VSLTSAFSCFIIWLFHNYFKNCLAMNLCKPIFAVPKKDAALVKGLRRLPFTEESRVRIPYVVQTSAKAGVFYCPLLLFWLSVSRLQHSFILLPAFIFLPFFHFLEGFYKKYGDFTEKEYLYVYKNHKTLVFIYL
jgi:hypothetical protein